MTGRIKHAQRSKRSYKKNRIPVDMFTRPAYTRQFMRQAIIEPREKGGFFARMFSALTRNRESRKTQNDD